MTGARRSWRNTNAMPSRMSRTSQPRSRGFGAARTPLGRIAASVTSEAMKVTAFTQIAATAPTAAITGPAAIGPNVRETDSERYSRELPTCSSCSPVRSSGRNEVYATWKNTTAQPLIATSAISAANGRTPNSASTAIAENAAACSASHASISVRRGSRSTMAPAGRPSTMNGANSANGRSAACAGEAPTTSSARSGSASSAN